jgi:hypothetical protein
MCNDYANHMPWSAYVEAFSEIRLQVVLPKAACRVYVGLLLPVALATSGAAVV